MKIISSALFVKQSPANPEHTLHWDDEREFGY